VNAEEPARGPHRTLQAGVVATAALLVHTMVNAGLLRRVPTHLPPDRRVSVLIPARDEADRIGQCVHAVLASDWDDLQVVVLDDASTDGTAEVVARVANGDPRVRVLHGRPTPAGWLGKTWACEQLGDAADGDVLVFVDADVVLARHAIAAIVALLDDGLDLACPYPRQIADGPLARLVQPLLQWSWLTFLPLRIAETSPRPSLAAANGQILACTAATYAKVGGHTAVRDEVLEDIALARACKRVGLRACVTDGTTLASCRMYRNDAAVVAGYTKSLWSAFGSPAGAAAITATLAWLYIHPVVAAVRAARRHDRATVRRATVSYLLGVAGRLVAAQRTGGRMIDAVAHPLSIAALTWLTGRSVYGHQRGTLEWSGRPVVAGRPRTWKRETERRA
jgi:glycosyltransferase involved in cell wall biosynthesis